MENEFNEVMQHLSDTENPFPAKYLHHLSDLEKSDLNILKEHWNQLSQSRKMNLLEDLINLSEAETLVNFDEIAVIASQDDDAEVKIKALELLDYSENSKYIPLLIDMIKSESNPEVIQAALVTSAHFVYQGELDEYPKETFYKLTSVLKELIKGEYLDEIKQNALEALGYSSERDVKKIIQDAAAHSEKKWISAILVAMGRSLDPHWKKFILFQLEQEEQETLIAAIKASGDIEIKEAKNFILNILKNNPGEDLIEKNAAWALARIGGTGVQGTLEKLLSNAESEVDIAFFEDCLDDYVFRHDPTAQSMFKFSGEDEDTINNDINSDDDFLLTNEENDFNEEDDNLE